MKRFVMGVIVGCVFMISATVIAEEYNILGKIVDATMPLYIDGQKAEKDLIIIEGTSYAPMRAAAGLFGYEIEYVPDKKEVTMTQSLEKKIQSISARNQLKPNLNRTDYMIYENEIYVPAATIGAEVADWDGTTLTLSLNGITITGTRESKLENGDPTGAYGGTFYVKLSALGLKGILQNGELIIE